MAFLDNSGDIILDAVLTETGRKRMTEGNFKITKFACGDDEINYTQYNKNHPSGSAYFDLEIMQTPVFEAVTETAAAINYGLLGITRTDILYLPSIELNTKALTVAQGAMNKSGSVFLVAVNAETYDKLAGASGEVTSPAAASAAKITNGVMQQGTPSQPGIVWESGINSTEIGGTSNARATYIVNVNMSDTSYTVKASSLLISDIYQLQASSTFYNNSTEGIVSLAWVNVGSSTATQDLDNYSNYTVRGISDLMFDADDYSVTDWSALTGPRGTAGSLIVTTVEELNSKAAGVRSTLWQDYGKINQLLFGGSSNKYDYIDTIIYVQGDFSSATAQIPIRLVRYAGT